MPMVPGIVGVGAGVFEIGFDGGGFAGVTCSLASTTQF